MLKSFRVRNFQSHKDLTLKFSPTVTTIVGSNDKGKSAVMRALQLACLNKLPKSPDAYIRHDEPKLVLTLKTNEHTIVRRKGKGVNSYTIDGKKLEAFGKGKVPEQIEDALNVGRENFQRQSDQHFWFSETPGQVSKHLNDMVNLGLIDKSLSYLASEVKKAKSDLEHKSDILSHSRSRLKELDWVPGMEVKLGKLEKIKRDAEKRSRMAIELETAVKAMRTALRGRNGLKRAARAGKRAVSAGKELQTTQTRHKRLSDLLDGMKEAQAFLRITIPDIKPLVDYRKKGDALAEKWRRLKFLIEDLTNMEKQQWELKGKIEAKESQLAKLAKNRRCPTCNRRLSKPSSSPISICRTKHRSAAKRKERSGMG